MTHKSRASAVDEDLRRVYRAVAAGESADDVRRVLEAVARGSAARREAAANTAGQYDNKDETPLEAAHRQGRDDLVEALIEAGADASRLFGDPRTTAVALCIAHGRPGGLRALLRTGRVDAKARIMMAYSSWEIAGEGPPDDPMFETTAAHLCVHVPCVPGLGWRVTRAQLECLEVLVREGGADANARDEEGDPPLCWLETSEPCHAEALDLLVALGADVNARCSAGRTPLAFYARRPKLSAVERLISHGARVDGALDDYGWTPLMESCMAFEFRADFEREGLLALLERSSPETRRHACVDGRSTVDCFVSRAPRDPRAFEPWHERVVAELLAAGAPVLPHHLPLVLAVVARMAERREGEWADRRSEGRRWRAHEDLVGLARDAREAREMDEATAAAERRLRELEERLRELQGEDSD